MGLGGGLGKGVAGGSGAGEWEKIKEVGAHSASGESPSRAVSVCVYRQVVCSVSVYVQWQAVRQRSRNEDGDPREQKTRKKTLFARSRCVPR